MYICLLTRYNLGSWGEAKDFEYFLLEAQILFGNAFVNAFNILIELTFACFSGMGFIKKKVTIFLWIHLNFLILKKSHPGSLFFQVSRNSIWQLHYFLVPLLICHYIWTDAQNDISAQSVRDPSIEFLLNLVKESSCMPISASPV